MERANARHTREAERVARDAERVSGEAERLWRVIDRLSADKKYESVSLDNQEERMEPALDYGNKLQESHKKFKPDAD